MAQDDLTGQTIAGYKILGELGQGGMAVVYRAHEQSLNRTVALKVIGGHLGDKAEFIERFKREAQAAARLSHPNIVQIYAIGEDAGRHYFAMEYVRGKSLNELIKEEGFLTAGRALPILEQVAQALAVAHEAGIIHRDIKPANIMLDESGRARVADFGIAQIEDQQGLTRTGALIGTPEYMSPEQCNGERPDARSDIYSLGVTFYQVLSGKTPFSADTPVRLLFQIMHGKGAPLAELNPTVPKDVCSLIQKMMALDPNERYQSARDLIDALEGIDTKPTIAMTAAAVSNLAAKAVPASASPSAPPPMPPLPSTSPPADLSTRPAPSEAPTVQPALQSAAPEPRKSRVALIAAVVVVALLLMFTVIAFTVSVARAPAEALVQKLFGGSQTTESAESATAAVAASEDQTPGAADRPGIEQEKLAESAESQPVSVPENGASEPAEATSTAAALTPSVPGEATPPSSQLVEAQPTSVASTSSAPSSASATPRASTATAQRSPAPSAASGRSAAQAALPASRTVVADVSGEWEYVDQVGAWIDAELGRQGYQVVDIESTGRAVRDVARIHVLGTAKLVSTRELEYFGRHDTQYTVALTLRAVDPASGHSLAGPVTETVQYTALNMQQNLEQGARSLAAKLARALP